MSFPREGVKWSEDGDLRYPNKAELAKSLGRSVQRREEQAGKRKRKTDFGEESGINHTQRCWWAE